MSIASQLTTLVPSTPDDEKPTSENNGLLKDTRVSKIATQVTQDSLFIFNSCMFAFMSVSWIVCLSLTLTKAKYATIPWYTNFAGVRPDYSTTFDWAPVAKKWRDIHIGHFSTVALFISSMYHLAISTKFKDYYFKDLSIGRNGMRWFDLILSSFLMHIQLSMIIGYFDVHGNILIGAVASTIMALSYLSEPEQDKKDTDYDPRPFYLSVVPFIILWSVLLCHFRYAYANANNVPEWVTALVITMATVDSLMMLHKWLTIKRIWIWKNYVFCEIVFVVLSVSMKQALAWVTFGGTLDTPDDN